MKNPKVSVVIPVFNMEKFIAEALDSAISQTYKNTEIICVDDCSTDNSEKIIKSYIKKNPTVFYMKLKKNSGTPIIPRNIGIKKATGKYILPLDADDKIASTYVEKSMREMQKSSADVVYCRANFFGDKKGEWKLKPYSRKRMLFKNVVFISALFRKSDWEEYGGYNEKLTEGLEDWDFWLNFVGDKKKFVRINETLFFYRILKKSRTSMAIDNKEKLVKQCQFTS
ncbi:MAG: glycosyltransferase family 2 protein [Alphaproteobacteria bacterium]